MLEKNDINIQNKVIVCKDYMNINFVNHREIDISNARKISSIFREYNFDISNILFGDITLDSLEEIESIIEDFLVTEGFYIKHFEFGKDLKRELLYLNYVQLKDRESHFKSYFTNPFFRFLLGFDFGKIPNTSDGKLLAYIDLYNVEFKYYYNNNSKHNSRIYELQDDSKISIRNLIEEKNKDEIEEEVEYNNYILEEMIDFITVVSTNKSMNSLEINVSEFKQSYLEITKFIKNNKLKIREYAIKNPILMLASNLFVYYLTGNFRNIIGYEKMINESMNVTLKNKGGLIFDNFFYEDLKNSLREFIKILNNDVYMKKNSF